MYPTGENITHPGHRPQVGDHAWVVPISRKWAKVLKVSQSTTPTTNNHCNGYDLGKKTLKP
jgi:hypothetical protein